MTCRDVKMRTTNYGKKTLSLGISRLLCDVSRPDGLDEESEIPRLQILLT